MKSWNSSQWKSGQTRKQIKHVLTRRYDTIGRACHKQKCEVKTPSCFYSMLLLNLKVSLLQCEGADKNRGFPVILVGPSAFCELSLPLCILLLWRPHLPGAHPA